jgi:hypothetical protein
MRPGDGKGKLIAAGSWGERRDERNFSSPDCGIPATLPMFPICSATERHSR